MNRCENYQWCEGWTPDACCVECLLCWARRAFKQVRYGDLLCVEDAYWFLH